MTIILPWVVKHDLTKAQYEAEFDRLSNREGYALKEICGYQIGDQANYSAIWEQRAGPEWWSLHAIPYSQYRDMYFTRRNEGYRPVRLNGHNIGGEVFFATIWEKRPGPDSWSRHEIPESELHAQFDELDKAGYRLVDISGYPAPDFRGAQFTMIMEKATDGRHWGWISPRVGEEYQKAFMRALDEGYRPVRVSGFLHSGAQPPYYTAVLEKGAACHVIARHGIDSRMHQHEVEHNNRTHRQISVGGFTSHYGGGKNATPGFCPVWRECEAGAVIPRLVDAFMSKFSVPGLSLAIAQQGGLVYAQGFGSAAMDTGEKVTPSSLFRIASASKPITAAAIMKLIEEGRIQLSDTVFGATGILGTTYGRQPYGTGIESITIQNLLEHTAGPGWSNDRPDPMYENPEMNQDDLVSWVINERPLNNAAGVGTKHKYSNFGYCLLGRVIERVTGEHYDTYVRQHILAPCGITNMHLAGNTRADRRADEVTYVDQDGGDPYGIPVTRMDAHGGWLSNAVDLMRFAVRVDGFGSEQDILNSASIRVMTTPSTAKDANGYAKGWHVNPATGTWTHLGRLEGTSSVLARTRHGMCWAALANTRKSDAGDKENADKNSHLGLDRLMWEIHDQADVWPDAQDI
ncbi:serine hydrolase [Streptomyces wuyuanensis]|uniref:CubicO group peptidase, beta-lactamase class C family n=1 Tax=Streptomyces wuyuanensis TaxID=1196353 RepID=A0A1H0DFH7_9ACTN|nr:serine hydrolase [Streptomyces wuyuanensis]SDN68741.1 CubicO group peptidase, beta-lactamase class C family [Streptomyces wuyuanensis]